jgi:alpha-N-arabinofuranosidase
MEGATLGVMRGIAAAGLLGKRLYISAQMNADAGSAGILRVYSVRGDGSFTFQEVRQGPSASGPVTRRDLLVVPADPAILALIVECAVEGVSGAAYFAGIQLSDAAASPVWREADGLPDFGPPYEAVAEVDAAQHIRSIPAGLFGTNLEWPWDGLGAWLPAANLPNPDLVRMAAAAGVTVHRYPGGVFADFYHWRNGVGPPAARPHAAILPGSAASPNRFGTDEALAFAEAAGGELMITVNVVTGTAKDAADWVAYVNRGRRRVRYWEIGNESYAAGQSGHIAAAALTPEQYAARFLEFARAMRSVDPQIQIGAIVDENFSRAAGRAHVDWTGKVLRLAAPEIDFLSLHCAYSPVIWNDRQWDARTVYAAMLASPTLIAHQLADLSKRVAAIAPSRKIKFAVTEWGPMFQMDAEGRFADHAKTLGSAIFTASALRAFIAEPRMEIANFFKLIDVSFQGSTGYRNGSVAANPSLYAIEMFTKRFGSELVHSSSQGPTYDSPSVGWADGVGQAPYLEVLASTSKDGKHLYILGINKHLDRSIQTRISIKNFRAAGTAQVHTLGGSSADSHTGVTWLMGVPAPQAQILPYSRFYSSGPGDVAIQPAEIGGVSGELVYTFPAHSITSIVLRRE